jgi:phosphohistidine phosphatase
MDLYIIRHAQAVDIGSGGATDDASRALTDVGRVQATRLGALLRQCSSPIEMVVTSPLLRSRQTAEGLLHGWPAPAPVLKTCEKLAPGLRRRQLSEYLARLCKHSIAIVGHMPDIAVYAAWLIGSNRARLQFEKAAVAHLACDDTLEKGSGVLLALVPPDWLKTV